MLPGEKMGKIKPLKSSPVFSNLSDKELALFSRIVSVEECSTDTVLLAENMKSESFYLIDEGEVLISIAGRNSEEGLTLVDGESFAEWALLGPRHLSVVSARVVEQTKLLVVKLSDFEKFMEEEPVIALKVQRELLKLVWDSVDELKDTIISDSD